MSDPGPGWSATLSRAIEGEEVAVSEVLAALYDDLRRQAHRLMRAQPAGHTLQTTALVHEAWIRLASVGGVDASQRGKVLALAAKAMRNLLVDHARMRKARKRGGSWTPATLELEHLAQGGSEDVLLEIDDALHRLDALDPDLRQIAELRLFGDLEMQAIAHALSTSERTVERRWKLARAWLQRELEAR